MILWVIVRRGTEVKLGSHARHEMDGHAWYMLQMGMRNFIPSMKKECHAGHVRQLLLRHFLPSMKRHDTERHAGHVSHTKKGIS